MRRAAAALALVLALAAAPASAHFEVALAQNLPPCTDAQPFGVWVVDYQPSYPTFAACSVDSGGGTQTLLCLCRDGAYSAIAYSTGTVGGQVLVGTDGGDGELILRPNSSFGNGEIAFGESSGVAEFGVSTGSQLFQVTDAEVQSYPTGGGSPTFYAAAEGAFSVRSLYIGAPSDTATSAGLARSAGDKLCHDTDADAACEAGEHYIGDGIEALFLGAPELYTIAGTATPGTVGTLHVYQGLPDAATTEVGGWVPVPASLRGRSFSISLLYAESSVGAACNFRVSSEAKAIAAGTSIGSGGTVSTSSIPRPSTSTSNLAATAQLSASFATTSSTVAIAVSVERIGADAADTCTTVLRVLGLYLEIL